MSFEKPERALTKEEWGVLSNAAVDKANDYSMFASDFIHGRGGGYNSRIAEIYARKANRIYEVLIRLEDEYYEAHPDEDPDKKGTSK